MAFSSSPMESSSNPLSAQSPQSIARNSPQVARIISPPVADTTWPQQGQVLVGSNRRRRHSLPQPVIPDVVPQEITSPSSNKPNLTQHMDLDGTTCTVKFNPICVNPPQHAVPACQQPGRTLNGTSMDLEFDPPSRQQINCGGSRYEQGIPFTRPPQLTLNSPTKDERSKISPVLKSNPGSRKVASRICEFSNVPCRQHHLHERRGQQRVQLGKRHIMDLDQDDDEDDDGYYTSSGPACKQFINEEKMAARMNSLNINGGPQTQQGHLFSTFWQAAPAHNSQRFEWQNPKKLPTFAELEARLSSDSSDPSEDESDQLRIEYTPELRKALRKRDRLIPDHIAKQMNPNCLQLVLWKPPAAILEEKTKGNSPPNNPNPSPAEASMDCISEPLNLTPPTDGRFNFSSGKAGKNGISPQQRNTSSPGAGWGANVQLFDSVDDDDMDL